MSDAGKTLKQEDIEQPVPIAWRPTLCAIVEAFKIGLPLREIPCVDPLSASDAIRLAANIAAYGQPLASLPEQTWQSSMCRWMNGHWDVLVDLFTAQGLASDLVLFVKVYESGQSYRFEIDSIHVP